MAFPFIPVIAGAVSLGAELLAANRREGIRDERLEQLMANLSRLEGEELREGVRQLTEHISSARASARQAAGSRAAALGRTSDVESFVLPAEGQVARAGSESLNRFILGTRNRFRGLRRQAEYGFANRPIEPGFFDLLGSTVGGVAGAIQNEDLIQTLIDASGTTGKQSASTTLGGSPTLNPPAFGRFGGGGSSGLSLGTRQRPRSLLATPRF